MDEIVQWIDKSLSDIMNSDDYQRYFGQITPSLEEGRQYLSNASQGIELVLSSESIVWAIHFFGDHRESE